VIGGARRHRQRRERTEGLSGPFIGLAPYTRDDSDYFFGRTREREVVIDNLLAYDISVLYGPSGVGKTSLLRAGVATRLERNASEKHQRGEDTASEKHQNDGREARSIVVFSSWVDDPVADLKVAIGATLASFSHARSPSPSRSSLGDMVAATSKLDGRLLIILDQFEEYFAYHLDGGGRDRFGEALAELLRRGEANVLISIREDALAQLDRLEGLIPNLYDNLVRLGPMDRVRARKAIIDAIKQWSHLAQDGDPRVSIEPELLDAVLLGVEGGGGGIADAAGWRELGAPGEGGIATPYLQLVMSRLWEVELGGGSRTLRLATLERLGGTQQILATYLDAALEDLSRREKDVAARVFRFLLTPSGTKIAQRGSDLAESAGLKERSVTPVLERLTRDARILRAIGDARYEIHHDALASPILGWCRRWEAKQALRRNLRRLFFTVCFAAAVLAVLALIRGLEPLELSLVDERFSLRGAQKPPQNLVLVKIDDASLRALHRELPLPRRTEGDAIELIVRDKPKVIAYDVEFTAHSKTSNEDQSLLEAIYEGAHRTVLAATETSVNGATNLVGEDASLREIGARPGYSALTVDLGGAIRRPVYAVDHLKSFAVVASEVTKGVRINSADFDKAWIDYYGPPGTLNSVSFADVLQRKLPRGFFRDKIVVVGVTSPSAGDYHATTGSGERLMSGVEIQANAIESVLRGLPLKDAPTWLTLLSIVVLGLIPAAARVRLPLFGVIALALAAGLLWILAALLAFDGGMMLEMVYPLAALVIATFAAVLIDVTSPRQ
jgi:CHASE2 domain-containing sensor protein